jgi:putative transposase
MNPRITLDNGHWYLSYSYEVKDTPTVSFDNIKFDDIIGIDLGVKTMAITSQGEVFDNPNQDETCKKLLNRIRFLQRRLSRKYEANKENKDENGHMIKTKNMIKLERKISRLWKRVRDYRKNARHQFTSAIIDTKPKVVIVEDLNTKGMLSNKKLAHAVGQVGFYELQRQLVYKGQRDGFYVVQAPRFYPSSQICSCCGKKTGPRGFDGLKVRSWECSNCHAVHDRDVNAARSLVLWLCDNTSGSVCWNKSSGSLVPTLSTFEESGDETQFLLEELSIKEKVLSLVSERT